ncbi:hypothetical protein RRG08_011222 [Elysia crispata]|uniref:Uncharacterized protein n=1 Tax=Elysia crispata TaxID=231223 RepID=A0AAE1E329_9GAST|nr:hypothetical protein RRG08_011222 [Elysia crispata]
MAITWGLVSLMLTVGVQNIEFQSDESQSSLPARVPVNIWISSGPTISPGVENSSAHSRSRQAFNVMSMGRSESRRELIVMRIRTIKRLDTQNIQSYENGNIT